MSRLERAEAALGEMLVAPAMELPGRVCDFVQAEIEPMLRALGSQGACKYCNDVIYWLKTKNDKWITVDPWGEPHKANCQGLE